MSENEKKETKAAIQPLAPPNGRIPEIPRTYVAPAQTLGSVPAICAKGFEVSRCPNTPEAIATAQSRGQVIVHKGDRNPDDPSQPLIVNEEVFAPTADGALTYRGDLLLVWRSEYAEKFRAEAAERAKRSSDGVKINRAPVEGASKVFDAELAALAGK